MIKSERATELAELAANLGNDEDDESKYPQNPEEKRFFERVREEMSAIAEAGGVIDLS